MSGSYPNAQNGAVTSVPSSTTAVRLLAANPLRQGLTVANSSTAILYLMLGNVIVPTSSLFTVAMAASSSGNLAYYEGPFGYQGDVWGIWASANGSAVVTELT